VFGYGVFKEVTPASGLDLDSSTGGQ
jgi:hypothetical protein